MSATRVPGSHRIRRSKGAVSGAVELTPDQLDSLKKGKLYIQISSEKARKEHCGLDPEIMIRRKLRYGATLPPRGQLYLASIR